MSAIEAAVKNITWSIYNHCLKLTSAETLASRPYSRCVRAVQIKAHIAHTCGDLRPNTENGPKPTANVNLVVDEHLVTFYCGRKPAGERQSRISLQDKMGAWRSYWPTPYWGVKRAPPGCFCQVSSGFSGGCRAGRYVQHRPVGGRQTPAPGFGGSEKRRAKCMQSSALRAVWIHHPGPSHGLWNCETPSKHHFFILIFV